MQLHKFARPSQTATLREIALRCLAACVLAAAWLAGEAVTVPAAQAAVTTDIVFVARAHLATLDDIFDDELGPAGQFGTGLPKFAPGSKLMIRLTNGSLVTLVDGSAPSALTGNLIDVQSPDVSFDGTKIVFAGATTVDPQSSQYGWRLYEINVNGTGFHQINLPGRTFSSVPNNNPNNFNFGNSQTYGFWNDLFPAYLADGRLVFASSRMPSRTHYDGRHSYNLYVANADGTNLRRITSERGGLLHPTPLPDGRILATRWWNNFNQPSQTGIYNRIDNQDNEHWLPDGTLVYANPDAQFNAAGGELPSGYEIREGPNTWHLMALNPDGTNMERFAFTAYSQWSLTEDSGLDTYVAAQPAVILPPGGGILIAYTSQQDTSMVHSTLMTGIRVARPGVSMMYANIGDAIAGLTYDKAWEHDDDSPPYALHPWGMPDGTILFSYVTGTSSLPATGTFHDPVTGRNFNLQGSNLQYRLYNMQTDGSSNTLVSVSIGTADAMDAKPIYVRTGWTALAGTFNTAPNDDPRYGNVPNNLPEFPFSQMAPNAIQTATLHNPNVYANAPLDMPYINNSPPPGSVALAQVYIDANQFTGAYCYGNYPNPCATFKPDDELRAVLWATVPVSQRGEFTATVPADTPAFIVLRDALGRAISGWDRGYISVAQGNAYARPGETVTCVGCHFGHVSGSIDAVTSQAAQGWTNVAPYANVTASSYHIGDDPNYQPFTPDHVNDRHGWVPIPAGGPASAVGEDAAYQDDTTGWISADGQAPAGQWLELNWTTPMTVTQVHLVGPPPVGGDWGGFGQNATLSPYHITSATIQFYAGGAPVGGPVNVGQIEPLATGGTVVNLPTALRVDRMRFTVQAISGKWWWDNVAALNEIEVMGMAAGPAFHFVFVPSVSR